MKMNSGDLKKVWEIKALKRKPKEEDARKILEAIAKQVQPIMRKHNWRVKILSEFCPKNPRLLGVNVGAGIHIKLRLRRVNRDEEFLNFDEVLDTMLHELCHNAHAPHNSSFYKLWDELRKECEDLMSKGISGTAEGFDLPGRRLGGSFPQPSLPFLRKSALAAAEKRAKLNNLVPSGPVRLGGDRSSMLALNPREAAAMAAERRFIDNTWCGSESFESCDENDTTDQEPLAKGCGKSVASTEMDEKVILDSSRKRARITDNSLCKSSTGSSTVSESNSDCNETAQKANLHLGSSSSCPLYIQPDVEELFINPSSQTGVHDGTQMTEKSSMWECLKCTLLNPPLAPICELCSTQKPKDVDTEYNSWSCKFCTLGNNVKLDACGACGNWRYSTGAPVATFTTNRGT